MEIVKVATEARKELGKNANKRARKEGKVPGVLYGGDEVLHFSTTAAELKALIYTPDFKMAEVEIDGIKHKAILKDIQFHPLTDQIVHVDFLKLFEGIPVTVAVPLELGGNCAGVNDGGVLVQLMRKIQIKAVPEVLVNHISLDITDLQLGHTFKVRDIEEMDGITILSELNSPVVVIEVPRLLVVDEDDDEGAEGAEGEEGAEGAEGATDSTEAKEESAG